LIVTLGCTVQVSWTEQVPLLGEGGGNRRPEPGAGDAEPVAAVEGDRRVGPDAVAHVHCGPPACRNGDGVLHTVLVVVDRQSVRVAHRQLDVEGRPGVGRRLLVADVVVLHPVLELVPAEDAGELDGVDGVVVVLIGDEADAARQRGDRRQGQRLDAERRVVVAVGAACELQQVAQIAVPLIVHR